MGGVRLHWVELGSGPLVLLLHGFPEHWYSWRHQLPRARRRGVPRRRPRPARLRALGQAPGRPVVPDGGARGGRRRPRPPPRLRARARRRPRLGRRHRLVPPGTLPRTRGAARDPQRAPSGPIPEEARDARPAGPFVLRLPLPAPVPPRAAAEAPPRRLPEAPPPRRPGPARRLLARGDRALPRGVPPPRRRAERDPLLPRHLQDRHGAPRPLGGRDRRPDPRPLGRARPVARTPSSSTVSRPSSGTCGS